MTFQANHRFPFEGPNIEFCYLKHPRFGEVRGLRTLRNIDKGEELCENYDYDVDEDPPKWYIAKLKAFRAQEKLKQARRKTIEEE